MRGSATLCRDADRSFITMAWPVHEGVADDQRLPGTLIAEGPQASLMAFLPFPVNVLSDHKFRVACHSRAGGNLVLDALESRPCLCKGRILGGNAEPENQELTTHEFEWKQYHEKFTDGFSVRITGRGRLLSVCRLRISDSSAWRRRVACMSTRGLRGSSGESVACVDRSEKSPPQNLTELAGVDGGVLPAGH